MPPAPSVPEAGMPGPPPVGLNGNGRHKIQKVKEIIKFFHRSSGENHSGSNEAKYNLTSVKGNHQITRLTCYLSRKQEVPEVIESRQSTVLVRNHFESTEEDT